jgi:hypothetical protein
MAYEDAPFSGPDLDSVMSKNVGIVALTLVMSASGLAHSADLPMLVKAEEPVPASPYGLYNPYAYEFRGGWSISTKGPELGTSDINGSILFPKFVSFSGWKDYLAPRIRIGGAANLGGRTSYGFANAVWTYNYDRMFAEFFFGGMIHDGQLLAAHADKNATALGCRELYHFGANLGYRVDSHWSVMGTFEHASNGTGWWSHCPQNRGLNVTGVNVGYAF